jgi:hypothetical protein
MKMIAVATDKIGQVRNDAWRQCRQVVASRQVQRDNSHLLPEEQQRLVTEIMDKAAAEYNDHWWTSRASELMCYLTYATDAGGTPIETRLDWERPLASYLPAVSKKPGEERHIVLYLADMTQILLDPSEIHEAYLEPPDASVSDPMLLEQPSSVKPPDASVSAPLLEQPSSVKPPDASVSDPMLLEQPSSVKPPDDSLSAPLLEPPEITAVLPEKVIVEAAPHNIVAELPEEVLSAPLLERPDIVSAELPDIVEQPKIIAEPAKDIIAEPPEEIITAEKEIAEPPKQRKKAAAPPKHLMTTLPRKPQPKRAAKKTVRASPYPSRQKAIADKKRK